MRDFALAPEVEELRASAERLGQRELAGNVREAEKAGGLPAADQPGPSAGAIEACPDTALAEQVAASCLDGGAQCVFTVVDPEVGSNEVDWAPAWPPPRWVWVSEAASLRLLEVTGEPRPSLALAFQASGAVT